MWKWGTNVDHSMIGGSGEGDRRYHDDSQLFAAPGRDAYVESNFYADDESMGSDAHKAYDGSVDSRSTEGYPYGSTARAHYPWSYQDPLWRPTGERGKPVTPSHDRDAGGSIRKDSDSASWWSRQTSGGKDSVKRMRVVIGVVMATALVVLAGTITAAVLLSKRLQKDEIPVTVHGTVTFNNLTFVDDFRDLSSNASLAFKRDFCEGMSDILVPAVGSYDSCDVTDIRAGSVICEYILYYSKPADTSGADVLGEVDRTLAEDFGNNQDGRFKYWLPASEYLGLVPYTTVTPPVATTTATTKRSLTPTPTEPSTTVTVYGIVTFNNLIFVDDFRDHSSNAYLAFKRDFCEGMSDILVPAVGSYDSCDVTDIRNGSVICEYILYYSKPADTSGADVLGEINKTLAEDFGNNQDGRFKYWLPRSEYLGLVPYTTVTPPVAMTTATTERSLAPTPTESSTPPSPTQPSTSPTPAQPSTSPITTQPSTAPVTTQPSTSPTTTQPSTSPTTTQPSTSATPTQPSTSPTTTQPSTSPTTTQTSTSPTTTQPSTSPTTTPPSTSPTTTQPTTSPTTTQPSTSPTMTQPSTSPTTTQPSTSPTTTQLSTTPTMTQPSTTPSTPTLTTSFDPCASHPCVGDFECVPMGTDYRCDCPVCQCYNGATNKNCSIDIVLNNCAGAPNTTTRYYQDPFDCSGYIECSGSKPYHKTCTEAGKVVDPDHLPTLLVCTHNTSVQCAHYGNPSEEPTTVDPDGDPCSSNPCGDRGICSVNGTDFTCNCTIPVCQCGAEYVSKTCTKDFSCSGKLNGLYPHPFNCEYFTECYDERLYPKKCNALVFNPESDACGFPDDVACAVYV